MKKIGIVGGLSPESTLEYYRQLTALCRERGLGYNYPVIIIYSVNFQECVNLIQRSGWEGLVDYLGMVISSLHKAGAEFALISANTPHIVFDDVADRSPIPMLSIVKATGKAAAEKGMKKVGLLGTKFTMQEDFYPTVFSEQFGIDIAVPDKADQDFIHESIMGELVAGEIRDETREKMVAISEKMVIEQAIDGLILGCTELPVILSQDDVTVPVLDTTKIQVEAIFDYANREA